MRTNKILYSCQAPGCDQTQPLLFLCRAGKVLPKGWGTLGCTIHSRQQTNLLATELPGDGQEGPSTPQNWSSSDEILVAISTTSHNHRQVCFPPCPLSHPPSQAGGAGGAGRLHRARVPRMVTELRWYVPGWCSVLCFLCSYIQWKDVAAARTSPLGMFQSVLFPCIPPSPCSGKAAACCHLSPPVISKGWSCHLNNLLPFPKSMGSLVLLWSLSAVAVIWHRSDPGPQAQGASQERDIIFTRPCGFGSFLVVLAFLACPIAFSSHNREWLAIK